ncbi:MAG: hypothetical protein WAL61_18370 [Acidimicrobiales bacterium]
MAVPTTVPPDVQLVGAEDCGPKTVKVMVFVSLLPEEPLKVAVMELAEIAVLTNPEAGTAMLRVGDTLPTTVSDIPDPHVDAAVPLPESPP